MAGKIIADQIEHSTAGSLDTSYVVNGSAKAWVNFTGITTTSSRDSFNVSGLTDNGTGSTSIAFSSAMDSSNYTGSWFTNASTGTAAGNFGNDFGGAFATRTTSSYQVVAYASNLIDSFYNDSIIFGDLA